MQYAVIMAGGSGQRLWPLSRRNKPKQIIDLFQGKSLLRLSVDRAKGVFDPEHIMVVTNQEYADIVREHLPELPPHNVIGEPEGRDTANAIGLAATILHKKDPDSVMAVFSADHIIEPVEPFQEAIRKALRFLENHPRALFTFGIKATSAHTGFGYLKRGDQQEMGIYPVVAFKEKPNKSTARKYIRSGKYCWNSGMFAWRVDTILKELENFLPENAQRLNLIGLHWTTDKQNMVLKKEFPELAKISIDFGVMEKAREVYMCELDCHWSDVGSYQALADAIGANQTNNNVTIDNTCCMCIDSGNNIIISSKPDHFIAAIHADDMIIVHTDDATLICHRDETSHLKELIKKMQVKGLQNYT